MELQYVIEHMLEADIKLNPDGNTCPYHPNVADDGDARGDGASWGTGNGNGNGSGWAAGDGDGDADGFVGC